VPNNGTLTLRWRRWRSLSAWKYFASYFPARLHKTTELPADKRYILCYHPHGIISHGAFLAFGTEGLGFGELFPGITNSLLTLESNFGIPFYREYLLFCGVRSVSERSIDRLLRTGGTDGHGKGRSATIVIGGGREALLANPGRMTLILKNRRGFVRMAQQTGADLVPVLAFGENELYEQHTPATDTFVHDLQLWSLKNWRYTVPLLRSILRMHLMPRRYPLNIVVGEPVSVVPSPGEAEPKETDRAHAAYCEALQQLWDAHKDRFATAEGREELTMIA
jgi:2-acylglycerol O-acyltransferase 2